MTAITITPRNKKELLALRNFIKVNNLTYEESVTALNKNSTEVNPISKTPKEFKKELNTSIIMEEFSSKTTSFLEGLSWDK